jgi:FKBP-type peptidyl-prolyl cis-trans isomerase
MAMKRILLLISVLSLSLFWLACTPPVEEKAPKRELTTTNEKVSYAAGMDIGKNLINRRTEIDLEFLFQGIEDSFEGRETLLTTEEVSVVKKEYAEKVRKEHAQRINELKEKNKVEGEVFLGENGKKEGVVTTESGLQYTVLTEGNGPKPKDTEKVSVHYVGTLIDGTEFDSSRKRGQPATFPLNGVIRGWTEGLQLMPVGSTYRLFIPSDLAYGERGAGQKIGPNATLIFEVELLEIVEEKKERGEAHNE